MSDMEAVKARHPDAYASQDSVRKGWINILYHGRRIRRGWGEDYAWANARVRAAIEAEALSD